MYQFYYADSSKVTKQPHYDRNVSNEYKVSAVRPTMWEEHCLECSAPVCFNNCVHYIARSDGRCMRFDNGIYVYENDKGCCGQGARVKFRKWANMMTIIYPAMYEPECYAKLICKNQKLGNRLKKVADSKLPIKLKWESIRITEFLRRRKLRGLSGIDNRADAFIFHGYSFEEKPFNLIMEVYDSHNPVFKTALNLQPGENLIIVDESKLTKACSTADYLVKIYPENDFEAELDILWCDFVKGKRVVSNKPADKVKCVVWDLDNTLWNGTLIETDNPEKLQLRADVLDTIKALDERGIIQSIASKNDYDLAWPVVENLGVSDYFIYPQIHWNAKSGSMEQIAKSLNIGIDALSLVDDSVFERNQVSDALPQVRVYDAVEVSQLLSYPEFDVIITEESKNRRSMYKAEEKRNQLMQSFDNSDTVDFLKKCNICIELFEPVAEDEKLRCYELLVRTNQLNLSGKKYTEQEYETVLGRENHTNFALSCKDDFGSYGIVGFGQYKVVDSKLVFTEFAMSCRVAGKFVESALFSALLEKENCERGTFCVSKTKKNILLRNTLQNIGFTVTDESDDKVSYEFDRELLNKELISVDWR